MLIDTHCHLDFKDFDKDRDEVIKRAYEAGIKKIINIGCDLERSRNSIILAEHHDFIYASVGLHPHYAVKTSEKNFREMEELARHPKVVAIGECGLDYYQARTNADLTQTGADSNIKQRAIFQKQIALAIKLDKPLIIHCRDAHDDVLGILNSRPPGVIHFFSGNSEQVRRYLELGFFISFAGPITFSKNYDEVIKAVPLERILIETDAPYVAPEPYRGQRNEPAYVVEIAKKIAEIKDIPLERVAEQTTKNVYKLFNFN